MRASDGDGMTANGRGVRQVDEEGMDEHPGELVRGDGEFARTVGWIWRGEEGSRMSNVGQEKGGFGVDGIRVGRLVRPDEFWLDEGMEEG